MKLIFVTEIAPYVVNKKLIISGGGEAHVFFLAKELASRGHNVKVLTGRWKNTPRQEIINGVEFIRYGYFAPWFKNSKITALGNMIRNTIHCSKQLNSVIRKGKPDFIITPMTFAFPRVFVQAKINKIPLISEVHDVYEMPLYLKHYKRDYGWLVYSGAIFVWLYNHLPAYSELVETVSMKNIDSMVKKYRIKREKIYVTGNGIDFGKYKNSDEKLQLIVVTGRLVSYKRVDQAIRIFKKVKERISDMKLVIIGDGPERDRLKALGSGDITFLGFVSENEKIALLQNAKFLISCSEFEGFGIVPIEALACGAYPILSNIPAHKEIVGNYGYIFQSIDDAANRICELLYDDELRRQLSQKGREFVLSSYAWKNVCDNFLQMVKQYKTSF